MLLGVQNLITCQNTETIRVSDIWVRQRAVDTGTNVMKGLVCFDYTLVLRILGHWHAMVLPQDRKFDMGAMSVTETKGPSYQGIEIPHSLRPRNVEFPEILKFYSSSAAAVLPSFRGKTRWLRKRTERTGNRERWPPLNQNCQEGRHTLRVYKRFVFPVFLKADLKCL